MSTMRSPIRKGHSSQTQRAAPNHFVKKSDGVEASDISNATDEIRSCQANRVLHGCEGDSLQLKLKALNYSLKWNEKV